MFRSSVSKRLYTEGLPTPDRDTSNVVEYARRARAFATERLAYWSMQGKPLGFTGDVKVLNIQEVFAELALAFPALAEMDFEILYKGCFEIQTGMGEVL